MTEQHAFVTTLWLQELAAGLATGMWNNPGLIQRIYSLFTEAFVRSWSLILIVLHTAFWAVICAILSNRGFVMLFMELRFEVIYEKYIPCPDQCDSFSSFAAQTVVDPV